MTLLITSDLHLTERESDEYKWGIFRWIKNNAGKEITEILLLGDTTDSKDKHSAKLVNRLVDELVSLSDVYKIIWLMGNHDCFDPDVPFFKFLKNQPNIDYIYKPTVVDLSIGKATFIPAGTKWDFKLHDFPYVFTHATFNGAVAENGTELTGVNPHVIDNYKGICYSGDIHVPQTLAKGKIVYIGAPYHVRFGDSFDPRILYINDKGKATDWYYPAPMKRTFLITKPEDLNDEEAVRGDHVKVKCYLKRSEYVEWKKWKEEIRTIAKERGWELFGVESIPLELNKEKQELKEASEHKSSQQLVSDYVIRQKASDEHLKLGIELLK